MVCKNCGLSKATNINSILYRVPWRGPMLMNKQGPNGVPWYYKPNSLSPSGNGRGVGVNWRAIARRT